MTFKRASDKQLYWIKKLVDEKNITEVQRLEILQDLNNALPMNASTASKHLTLLFSAQKKMATSSSTAEEGLYLLEGEVYKVVKAKTSHKLYAKKVTKNGLVYSSGVVSSLTLGMKLEASQIAALGIKNGICYNCGKLLTDPVSVKLGLGTHCGPVIMGTEAYKSQVKEIKSHLQNQLTYIAG